MSRMNTPVPPRPLRPIDHAFLNYDKHGRNTSTEFGLLLRFTAPVNLPEAGFVGARAMDEEIMNERLPCDRPLWQLTILRGYARGEQCALFKVHHLTCPRVGSRHWPWWPREHQATCVGVSRSPDAPSKPALSPATDPRQRRHRQRWWHLGTLSPATQPVS